MKATHERVVPAPGESTVERHRVTIEGRREEFDMVIDALSNHIDERIQKLATYIRQTVSK